MDGGCLQGSWRADRFQGRACGWRKASLSPSLVSKANLDNLHSTAPGGQSLPWVLTNRTGDKLGGKHTSSDTDRLNP